VTTEKIHFECVQTENRAEAASGIGIPAWMVKREAEAFRDLIRAAAFEQTGKMPGKILFSWEVA